MAQYKVLEIFKDKDTQEIYKVGQEVELTVKRATEIEKNLKGHDKQFIERIDNKDKEEDEENEEDE